MTAASRAAFRELVRSEPVDVPLACLLLGAEVSPDLDPAESLLLLDKLAAAVGHVAGPVDAAVRLARTLGEEIGFHGVAEDYDDLRSSLLHEVLRRGRGLPILLSVVWVEVARRLGVPAVCLGKPAHVLVCLGDPSGDHVVVDPFHRGVPREVSPEPVLLGTDLLLRVLTNIRAWSTRQPRSLEAARTRLWATELSLMLPSHPLELRRERGELLVRLGAHQEGAAELEAFADATLDDTVAEDARRGARLARSRLN